MRLILKNMSFSSLFRFALVISILSAAVWINRSDFSEGQELQTAKSLGIKIISPIHNQTVPVGSGFNILGTSTATDIGNCYVSVIINNIKPYQNATASGPNGIKDYSKWNFTLLHDKYTPIKEGQNKITSKLSCLNGNNNTNSNSITTSTNLTKWSSVNVTGVTIIPSKSNDTQTTTTDMIQQPVMSAGHNDTKASLYKRNNTTSSSKILKGNNNELTAQVLPSTTSSALSASKTNNNNNNNINNINNKVKPLSIAVQSSQNIVNGKGKSTVTAIAYDVTSGKKIDYAVVKLKITFISNGTTKMISDYKGEATYSVDIKPDSNDNNNHGSSSGSFTTTVQAFAPGYNSAYKTTTMTFNSSSNNNSSNSSTNNINDLAYNIINDVKKKIKDSIFN
jgi:hypothetical protein